MKKSFLNKTAAIVAVWGCVVINYVLVRFSVPHAIVISLFIDAMVAIPMVAFVFYKRFEKIIIAGTFIWWWLLVSYIVYTMWGLNFDSAIAVISVAVITVLLRQKVWFENILVFPFALVGILLKND